VSSSADVAFPVDVAVDIIDVNRLLDSNELSFIHQHR
jgi:hypothetical protein